MGIKLRGKTCYSVDGFYMKLWLKKYASASQGWNNTIKQCVNTNPRVHNQLLARSLKRCNKLT